MKLAFVNLTRSLFLSTLITCSIAPKMLAATFSINGLFDDGGTVVGSFDFDNDSYSNFNLQTKDSFENIIASYVDSGNDGFVSGSNATGFIISDLNFDFDLTIEFGSSLPDSIGTILTTNSNEEDFNNGSTRFIVSGTVTVIPEISEPSSLGFIFPLGTGFLFLMVGRVSNCFSRKN
ncbi:MAG: hypothetical protein QNJ37_04120 [Crocosphaera sp.]|nr:hypothetical protein [Crocosphaera sp.]